MCRLVWIERAEEDGSPWQSMQRRREKRRWGWPWRRVASVCGMRAEWHAAFDDKEKELTGQLDLVQSPESLLVMQLGRGREGKDGCRESKALAGRAWS